MILFFISINIISYIISCNKLTRIKVLFQASVLLSFIKHTFNNIDAYKTVLFHQIKDLLYTIAF